MDLDDALDAARSGDRDGIAALYRAFAPALLAYLTGQTASRQDAEDALGEVFVAAVRDLGRFTGDAAAFKGWLYRIATNRAIDLGRRRSRRPEQPLDEADLPASAENPERAAIAAADRARLWKAIGELSEAQRQVVTLRLSAGLSTAEIADVLGKQANAVKALQHRALLRLTQILGAYPSAQPERLGDEEDRS